MLRVQDLRQASGPFRRKASSQTNGAFSTSARLGGLSMGISVKASVSGRWWMWMGLVGACSGCAMFRPVQLYPEEWNEVETPVARPHALTEEERRQISLPPADLDDAIARANREYQRFFIKEHAALSVPQHIGNLLIGLASFGVYRGVTNPSTKTTAGVAALGTAAYAGGTAVDWNAQSAVFYQARVEFLCLIGAAEMYTIRAAQDPGANLAATGRRQLLAAGAAVRENAASLDDLLARHAALNQQYLETRETVRKGPCPDAGWDVRACTLPPGTTSPDFEKTCRELQARHARMCAARKNPAVYSTPAPEVSTVFAAAERARADADDILLKSARTVSVSDRSGLTLWRMTNAAINKASAGLRPTGTDLAKLMAALKSPQQPKPGGIPTARGQSGRFAGVPGGAGTHARQADAQTIQVLAAIEAATLRLINAEQILKGALAANANMPEQLDESKFEACLSPEVKLAQALAPAEQPGGASASASASSPQDAPEKALSAASDEELAELGLPHGAPVAEIETRLRTCQRTKGLAEDARLTGAMQRQLREGLCRGIAWK
jgi:hypothetical protein